MLRRPHHTMRGTMRQQSDVCGQRVADRRACCVQMGGWRAQRAPDKATFSNSIASSMSGSSAQPRWASSSWHSLRMSTARGSMV